jgi:hypothetical protein
MITMPMAPGRVALALTASGHHAPFFTISNPFAAIKAEAMTVPLREGLPLAARDDLEHAVRQRSLPH